MNKNTIAEIYRGVEITNGAGFAAGTFSARLINCISCFAIEDVRRAIDNAHEKAERDGRWLAGPKPSWAA